MNDSSDKIPPEPSDQRQRTLRVAALARVEGEGALHLRMRGRTVDEVRLEIYEPPRFYEAFLRGRDFRETPDITARICGICPVAYQMGSCHALEKAVGVFGQLTPVIHDLRRVLYCGEWIESHVLHMFLLHLPDFLGYESAITMAESHGDLVKQALGIKRLGNDLVALLGGRAVHPVGVCVGGFHRPPDTEEARRLADRLAASVGPMSEIVLKLARELTFPDLRRDYEFLSLKHESQYPMNLGRIVSNRGIDIAQEEFLDLVEEFQVPHSTAYHARLKRRGAYLVGPLARLNLNADKLHPEAAELLRPLAKAGFPLPWRNNFFSLLARGVETVHALATARDLLAVYQRPASARVEVQPRAGVGGHGTEAPRGLCWHHYEVNPDGLLRSARIVPPTSQNQTTIEDDLREFAPRVADAPDEQASLQCEHLIRNYDPCISCSVHFLKFHREFVGDTS